MTFRDPHSESERPVPPRSVRAAAPWDPDDPRWSAYLLGEMSPAERLAVEAVLEEDLDARHDFEELADAADLVRLAFESAPRPAPPFPHAEESPRPLLAAPVPPRLVTPAPAAPVDAFVRAASAPSLTAVAPSKRRSRSGGLFVFLSVVASLGLCLMLVVHNPAGQGPGDSRFAAPAVAPITVPVATSDVRGFGFSQIDQQPNMNLAAATENTTGAANSAHSFRITPSLALSYLSDSSTSDDAFAVVAHNADRLDRFWYDAAAGNRSLSSRVDTAPAGENSGEGALASRVSFEQSGQKGSGEQGRGNEASDDSPGIRAAVSPLRQAAPESESKLAPIEESELREVVIVSRFQTAATVPVAAIPVQVGRQSMADIEQSLARGEWPVPESIRLEEMVNAFEYDDPLPPGDDVAELRVESGACPWNERHRLVRIGLRAEPIDLARRPTFRAVFVVDSRRPEMLTRFNESLAEASRHFSSLDRVTVLDAFGTISLPTVAGDQLEDRLRGLQVETDRTWAVPAAAGNAPTRTIADSVPASVPLPAVQVLRASPVSSAGAAEALPAIDGAAPKSVPMFAKGGPQRPRLALENAFGVARETFVAGANNSVVLLTDESLKAGESDNTRLIQDVRSNADFGVNLSVVDVNANYSNPALYRLVDLGNGRVNTVSTTDELSGAVVQELAGGEAVIATEVQLQIEFNPVRVEAYRLLGYEHWNRGAIDPRLLAAQKELHAGDRLCAVIEVRLNPETSSTLAALPLRYRQSDDFFVNVDIRDGEPPAPPVDHEKEWLTARLIYTPPGSSLQSIREVPFDGDTGSSSPALDWAACVVEFGERLNQPERLTTASLQGIRRRAQESAGPDPLGTRQKFLSVLDRAIDLTGRTAQQPAGPAVLSSGEARARATCEGRYRDLLDKIAVPGDHTRYGTFHDLGFQPARTYKGHAGLPAGYWAYVYPHWYIWSSAESQVFMAAPPP